METITVKKQPCLSKDELLIFWKNKAESHFKGFPDKITKVPLYSDTVDILNPQFLKYLQDHSIILTEDALFPKTPVFTGLQCNLIPLMIEWYDIKGLNEIVDILQWNFAEFKNFPKDLGTNFGSTFINR